MASKFWYVRGGLERVMLDEVDWLQDAGFEVAHFAASHPLNRESEWSDFFVPYLELGEGADLSAGKRVRAVARLFYNAEAARRFRRLLAEFRPDVVHVHGIHRQLSPSILVEARRAGVPVVQTLHDYHPVCPNDTLLRGDRRVCVPPCCRGRNVLPCVKYRCVRGSRAVSALSAAELYWRRWLLHYDRLVDVFVSPSRYLAGIMRAGGWRRPDIEVVPNSVTAPPPSAPGEAFLYAGRLSFEKGLATLLEAAALAGVPLTLVGDGPEEEGLRRMAPPNATFLGRRSVDEVQTLLSHSLAAVVPSEWPENAPLAVLEPMAAARPVVATRVGGIPELMRDGGEGLLVPPGQPSALADALVRLEHDRRLAHRLGRAGRERVVQRFTPTLHLDRLVSVYRWAVGSGIRPAGDEVRRVLGVDVEPDGSSTPIGPDARPGIDPRLEEHGR